METLLIKIVTGGLLGIVGQGLRMIVGLKKWYDDKKDNTTQAEAFDLNRFLISLFIGFVAGILAILFMIDDVEHPTPAEQKKYLASIILGGYTGVDFIEGFVNKYLPKKS